MLKRVLFLTLVLSLLLVACGGGGEQKEAQPSEGGTAVVGNAENGKKLFEQTVIGPKSAPGCVTCHSLEPGVKLVGPSLAGVASRGDEAYLRESIVNPNAVVVEGFPKGVMYQNYGKDLSEQEIADLVAFLMTLK